MSAPAYTTDLITFNLAENSGTWVEMTGYTAGGSPDITDTDNPIQGSYHVSQTVKTGLNSIACNYGSGVTVVTDGAFFIWSALWVTGLMAEIAAGGLRALIGSGVGDFKIYYVGGKSKAPNPYGGYQNIAVDPTLNGDIANYGSPSGVLQYVGIGISVTVVGTLKGQPHSVDAIRYGRGEARMTGGDVGSGYATFSGLATINDASAARWGLFQAVGGGYLWKGLLALGAAGSTTTYRARSASNVATLTTAAVHGLKVGDIVVITGVGGTGYNATAAVTVVGSTTTFSYANTGSSEGTTADVGGTISPQVDFRDSNKSITVDDQRKVGSSFNKIEIRRANSRVDWTGITITSLCTASPGSFEVVDDADVNFDTCIFTDMSTFIFKTASSVLNCTFRRCGLVTAGGGIFTNTLIAESAAVADAYAFKWDESTDPDGKLDNMSFTKGTLAHHAIYFGSSIPTSISLRGISFSGFNASDSQNDSALYFADTAGTAITVYLYSCSGNIKYKSAGCTVGFVQDSVTVTVTTKEADGTIIGSARVLLKCSDGTGPFPFEESVTSIVNASTTATVTHTGHGMLTNDKVLIEGASLWQNNGVFSITRTNDNVYTYTLPEAPGSSPTGTIIATYVVLEGTTDPSTGIITMSRVFSDDQPVVGWARKSSSAPYYKEGPLSGGVDFETGGAFTAILSPDE